ncbi:MFS transporter [Aeromicrobium sp.]|uniref:MFS transporter n=1 Tax=Aeromicrobium sp. TaxID=1871063 RepID=UPI0025C3DDA8|nr:MFS transporter [Aeromicrobium sp.]MCK5892125.1 MFS transporter [Aeromicrobium sp.]
MSALQSYRLLVRTVGPVYVAIAFLGRVPLAMSQMGTLLLVSDTTGSYAVAGGAAGALAVANAVGAPVFGSLADRTGQRPVVLGQSLVGGAGLVLLVLVAVSDAPSPLVIATSALAGLAIPQIGPLARVRWGPVLVGTRDRRRLLDAAFSYEGAADELSFVLGPATVGLLAVLVDPSEALLLAAVVLALFGSAFALHPTAALTRPDPSAVASTGRLLTGLLLILAAAQLLIGMLFGATQTGSTVLATAEGQPGLAGVIHATLGIGSAIAGLAVAALPEQIGYPQRLVAAATGLVVLSAPLLLVETVGQLVAVIALLGFAVAPFMISTFATAGQIVAPDRVGTAMTLLAGATGVGYALGSSLAGRLADGVPGIAPDGGHTPAFAVTFTATVLALAVSLILLARTRRT